MSVDQGALEEVVDYTLVLAHPNQARYDAVVRQGNKLVAKLGQYIWYKEAFNLNNFEFGGVHCLFGSTDFGGCVEDEWVIVWILKTLSESFSDLYIRVADTDGEFLMIEAAESIPKWIEPEVAENRVWISRGKIGLIPERSFPKRSPSIEEAFDYLLGSGKLVFDPAIATEAFDRISEHPAAAIEDNTHRAAVVVPRKVASILHGFPQYISSAVDRYVNRGSNNQFLLDRMDTFSPSSAVSCVLKLTRRQYARLVGDTFRPNWQFEGADNEAKRLGEKITCGMELLAKESFRLKPMTPQSVMKNPDFQDIIVDLSDRGYFKDYATGTPEHNKLMQKAIPPFMAARQIADENAYLPVRIRQAAASDDEIDSWDKTTDDDSWLYSDMGNSQDMPENLKEMLAKLEEFMNDQNAGLEGVDDVRSSDSSSNDEEEEKVDPNDPAINEDDFLEYFMKEALNLNPEEIESYRAESNNHDAAAGADDDDDDDDDWAAVEQELRDKGVVNDGDTAEVLHNLVQSVKTGGATGPAATLLKQMGVDFSNL